MIRRILDRIKGKAPAGAKRSSAWPAVRKAHLLKHDRCLACGGTSKLEVHHLIPFHIDPSRELDPTNLITLCESGKGGIICHLAIGHLGNYRNANPVAWEMACWWRDKMVGLRPRPNSNGRLS
jgi:hypothetical protein